MHLRSGRSIATFRGFDTDSSIPTLGSGTRSIGNLERITEEKSLDTESDTTSMAGSKQSNEGFSLHPNEGISQSTHSRDMHAPNDKNLGKTPMNASNKAHLGLEYDMKLKF